MIKKMHIGRFIYSDQDCSAFEMVRNAVDEYVEKTGVIPDLAIVHPSLLYGDTDPEEYVMYQSHKIRVLGDPMIAKKIVYIGVGVPD